MLPHHVVANVTGYFWRHPPHIGDALVELIAPDLKRGVDLNEICSIFLPAVAVIQFNEEVIVHALRRGYGYLR